MPVDAAKLGQIAWKLGFGHFRDDDILALWRIGILRADLIRSDASIHIEGLLPVPAPMGTCFTDVRMSTRRSAGSPTVVPEAGPHDDLLSPYFHPFRVYVLHHVVRTLRITTSSTQFLRWTPGVIRVVDWQLRELHRWTDSSEFVERFDHWNRVVEFAVVCEPLRWLRPNAEADEDKEQAWLRDYATGVRGILKMLGTGIDNVRRDLAFSASECDSNSRIHTLLRLMKPFERERIEGRLGAAMKFLEMAESIRRAAERLLGGMLPEEDELGPGTWMDGARAAMYGTERVYDAPPGHLRDFLGVLGLDVGVKVRCYIEGETEVGALRHAIGASRLCAFINLQGKVLEKHGKGLAFADSLASDKDNHMFSIAVLDADKPDIVRMIRTAAAAEVFHGSFVLFDPDLELANFTTGELLHVALSMSARIRGELNETGPIHADVFPFVEDSSSGKDFFRRLHHATNLTEIDKGEDWGAALMAFAIEHPEYPVGHPRAGETRRLVEIAQTLVRAQSAPFKFSLANEKVDPSSGRIIPRNPGIAEGSAQP